jgi:flagellar hook-length control protein FliK
MSPTITAASSAPPTLTAAATATAEQTAAAQTNAAQADAADATSAAAVADAAAGARVAASAAGSSTDDDATASAGSVATDTGATAGDAGRGIALASVTPAALASAQAAAALANIGVADKHSHNAAGDSSLPGTTGSAAAGAAQLSANSATATDAPATPTLNVAAPVESPEFGQGVANHVSWMVDNNLQGAKLQVNPPQLGPIEVRIAVQGDHAQVWLVSHSALTRDALEASSPKLREMLGAQGFGQVSVDVSQRSFQERTAHSQPYEWTPAASRSPTAAALPSTANPISRVAIGAVDAYA